MTTLSSAVPSGTPATRRAGEISVPSQLKRAGRAPPSVKFGLLRAKLAGLASSVANRASASALALALPPSSPPQAPTSSPKPTATAAVHPNRRVIPTRFIVSLMRACLMRA